jgi:hypothetical protein
MLHNFLHNTNPTYNRNQMIIIYDIINYVRAREKIINQES